MSVIFIDGSAWKGKEVGKAIYEDYLPKALAAGSFVRTPEPIIGSQRLESCQEALEVQKRGLSRGGGDRWFVSIRCVIMGEETTCGGVTCHFGGIE